MEKIGEYTIVKEHKNCDGGLLPATNMPYWICIKCKCAIRDSPTN